MNIDPDTLEHLVLQQAEADWLEIGNASAYAGDFEEDLSKRKALLLRTIRSLAEAGYIRIGHLQRHDPADPDSLDWAEWPGTLDDQMTRLAEVYTPEVPDHDAWYWACWLNLTDAGQEVVEALPKPNKRFFDGLL
ncbi:hypothetical protein AB4Z18_05565 [Leifsonia sp. 2TAF2]|uniref:hypothetical protein n=1 Tax=Leifsonia sp. 2TAF2 TaxID=3233009 RepID=UPI003F9712CA